MVGINIGIGVTGLEQFQKAVTLLEKSGKVGDQVVKNFKEARSTLAQFVEQVSKLARSSELASISLKQLVLNTEKLNAAEAVTVRTRLKREAVDNLVVAQARKLLQVEAELVFLQQNRNKGMIEAIAAAQAKLAVEKGLTAQTTFLAEVTARLTTSTAGLTSGQIANLRAQEASKAVSAGLASSYRVQAAATKELITVETAYNALAIQSAAQASKREMALALLSAQEKKRSALLSELNALENGYTAALARSLAPLEARVALSRAKNVADLVTAKQMTVNAILQSKETLEIKQQALAYAGIPPLKMAVAAASEVEAAAATASAGANTRSAAATVTAGRAAGGAAGAFTVYGSAVRGAAGAMGMLWFAYGQLLPLMAAFAAASAVKVSIAEAADFDYLTASIYSLNEPLERAKISLADLRKELLHLKEVDGTFAELIHTPVQLAEGMEELARSGKGMSEALREMPELSRMAALGHMELGEAVKATIGGVNAFKDAQADSYVETKRLAEETGIEMDKTIKATLSFGDVANMIAKAADTSSAEIEGLADALKHATETGVIAGLRLDEVLAAFAVMHNAGIRGTNAATAFRTGMLKLYTPTKRVAELLSDINMEFTAFREDGSSKNLVEMMTDLNKVMAKLTDEKRIGLFKELFTVRSGKSAILAMNPEQVEEFSRQIREAAGEVSYLETRFNEMKTTVQVAAQLLGVEFKAMLTENVNNDAIRDALYGVLDVLKVLRPYIGDMISLLGDFFKSLVLLGSAVGILNLLAGIKTGLMALPALFSTATVGAYSLSAALFTLKGAFAVVSAAAAGWAIGTWLRENVQIIDAAGIEIVAGLLFILDTWKLFAKSLWDIVSTVFVTGFDLLKTTFGWFMKELGQLLEKSLNWLANQIESKGAILGKLGVDVEGIAGGIRGMADSVGAGMTDMGNSLSGGRTPVEVLTAAWSGLTTEVEENFRSYIENRKAMAASRLEMHAESKAAHAARKEKADITSENRRMSASYEELARSMEAMAIAEAESRAGRVGTQSSPFNADELQTRLDKVRDILGGLGVTGKSELQRQFENVDEKAKTLLFTITELQKAGHTNDLSKILQEFGFTVDDLANGKLVNLREKLTGALQSEALEAFGVRVKEAFGTASQDTLSEYQKRQQGIKDTSSRLLEEANKLAAGTPAHAAAIRLISDEMANANAAAESLEQIALDDFSNQMEEAFGDASTGKLSSFDKMMEKIDDTVIQMEAKIKAKFDGDDNGLALMRKELEQLKTEAQQTADELRKSELAKNLEEIEEAFGKKNQRYMSDYDRELAKINQTFADQYDIIDKKYPLEQASNQTLADRAVLLDKLNAEYQLTIQNSDVLIKNSQNLWSGFTLGAKEAIRDMKSLGEIGYDIAFSLRDAFSNTFFKVMKGEFEDIGDLWESLLDSMLDMFIRFIADLIAQWVMSGIIGMLTGNGLGGFSLNMNGSGGGFNLGSAASMASSAYSMYTGNSLGGTAAYAAYSYLYPQTTIAPYGLGASQYLGQTAIAAPTAAPTVAPAAAPATSTTSSASMAASAAPYMAAAAWVAAAAISFYSFQKSKMEPTPADMYNQMGLRPENFAYLIGQEFQRTVVPVFGEVTAKWDQASNSMVMLADQEKYKAQRERDINRDIYSERGIKTMTWDASSPTWRVQVESMVEAALRGGGFGQLGITPRTMEEFAAALERMNIALEPSTIKGIWDWGQATQTSTEKVKLAFEDLGLGGSQMVRAMELLERATTSATKSTEELEKYLKDLGYTQEQVSTALQEFSGSEISRMQEMGEAAMAPLMEAARAMGLVFDDLEGSTMSSVRSVDRFGNVIEHLPGNAAADSVELLNETMGELPGYFADAASAVNTFSGSLTGLHEIATGTATMTGNTPVAMAMNGGPIGYLSGGILRGGSGMRDDLYLGHVNGRAQIAQGGEYIINKDSTRKHRAALDIINADRYATGGPVAEGILQFVRSLVTGNLPSPDDGIKGVGSLPSTTRSSRTADDLEKLQEIMADVAESMMLMEATDLEKAFYESDKKFKEMAEEARKLGASEADLIEIEKLRLATNAEIMAEYKKAQTSFMQDINDQISAFSMSDMELAIRDTVRAMEEAIEKAKELGLSETEIAKIRELQALQAADIIEQQRRAQFDFMQDINDQLAMFGMSDMEKALLDNRRAMEEALKQADELGLGESDLARVRELYGKKAQEIMNQGLTEAITSMESFRTSLAGASGESLKSAAAQQDLFDILSQARAGDFSGVEKIGDVLNDISIDKSKYATAVDYARDYWKTMGAVSELEKLTQLRVDGSGNLPLTTTSPRGTVGGPVVTGSPTGPVLQSVTTVSADTEELIAEIKALRESVVAGNVQLAKNTSKTTKILDRWEVLGLPINSSYEYTESGGVGSGTITRAA